MSAKIGVMTRAVGEVQAGSNLIVKAIDRIKEIAKTNADLATSMQMAMEMMVTQSETLRKEMEKFRTEQGKQ